jgi:voltage-dependent potassium channel beta subunit
VVRYRKLGHSGLEVSAVGLGSWLTYGDAVGDDTARACILRALELGVNFFDTANEYAQGAAEETLGRVLAEVPHHSYVVSTKLYWAMGPGPNDWGLSRKHIFEQVHASMRRLGIDYIDLYQCHRYDRTTPLGETCQAMSDLIRMGKILYWGVSEWTASQILEAVLLCRREGWTPPVSNQPQYSALWRTIERDVLPVTHALGLGNVVWSPLAMGILTGKYVSVDQVPPGSRGAGPAFPFNKKDDTWQDMPYFTQPVLDAVQQLKPLAVAAGCTLAQLALAWCLRQDGVSCVITGAKNAKQVEDNAGAADLDLDSRILDQVTEGLRPVADFDAGQARGL